MSLDETLRLGAALGRKLRGGEVIELVSDLGGGKTALVRGIAQGMGCQDEVSSPSFTLSNEYRAKELTLHHFDFYRLQDPGIMRAELQEAVNDDQSVVAVEWAQIVKNTLPDERVTVHIKNIAENENGRSFKFTYPGSLGYLIPTNE